MKKNFKAIAVIISIVLVVSLFAGCSNKPEEIAQKNPSETTEEKSSSLAVKVQNASAENVQYDTIASFATFVLPKPPAEIKYLQIIKETVVTDKKIDFEKISEQIKKFNDTFDQNDYKIIVHKVDDENFIVDYVEKLGESETNLGYIAFVEDGSLNQIVDNTSADFESKKQELAKKYEDVYSKEISKDIFDLANKDLPENITVNSQNAKYRYDAGKNILEVVVLTEFTDDGGARAVKEFHYKCAN